MLILRGFLQGQTTQHIAEELGLDYGTLLSWRHRIQRRGFAHLINSSLPDTEAKMDEMFQNAGEKGEKKDPIAEPPRRRAINAKVREPWQITVYRLLVLLDAIVVKFA